jgi:hypothetical protein
VTGTGENCIMRSFIICTLHLILLVSPDKGEQDGQSMWKASERDQKCEQHLIRKPEGRLNCRYKNVIRWVLKK